MSPTTGRRPGQRPGGIAAFAPIIVAVCAIVLVREGMEAVFPDLNTWVAFIVALAVGWLAYAAWSGSTTVVTTGPTVRATSPEPCPHRSGPRHCSIADVVPSTTNTHRPVPT